MQTGLLFEIFPRPTNKRVLILWTVNILLNNQLRCFLEYFLVEVLKRDKSRTLFQTHDSGQPLPTPYLKHVFSLDQRFILFDKGDQIKRTIPDF